MACINPYAHTSVCRKLTTLRWCSSPQRESPDETVPTAALTDTSGNAPDTKDSSRIFEFGQYAKVCTKRPPLMSTCYTVVLNFMPVVTQLSVHVLHAGQCIFLLPTPCPLLPSVCVCVMFNNWSRKTHAQNYFHSHLSLTNSLI